MCLIPCFPTSVSFHIFTSVAGLFLSTYDYSLLWPLWLTLFTFPPGTKQAPLRLRTIFHVIIYLTRISTIPFKYLIYGTVGMAQRELGKIELKENTEMRPLCNPFMKKFPLIFYKLWSNLKEYGSIFSIGK